MLPVIRAKQEHAGKRRQSHRACFALFCSLLPFWLLSTRQQCCVKENLNRFWRFQSFSTALSSYLQLLPNSNMAINSNMNDCHDFLTHFFKVPTEIPLKTSSRWCSLTNCQPAPTTTKQSLTFTRGNIAISRECSTTDTVNPTVIIQPTLTPRSQALSQNDKQLATNLASLIQSSTNQ